MHINFTVSILCMKNILTAFLFLLSCAAAAQTIDAGDTVIFDLSHASCIGNEFLIPVSFKSDDNVYAIDFSMKYDQAKITFSSIDNPLPSVNASAYYDPLDSTLRMTSFSMDEIPQDTPVVSLKFNMTSYPVTASDFNTVIVYLNGDVCSYKFIPPFPNVSIVPGGSLAISGGDSVALSAPTGNGYTYLWSTLDTAQTIYASSEGTYAVTVTTAGGCSFIDSVMVTMSIPLPVELTDFTARLKQGIVYISWSTSSENNCDYFDVQHSTDNAGWNILGKVEGAGNSTSTRNYSLRDPQPEPGNNYYRLVQFDFDGARNYFEIEAVNYTRENGGPIHVTVFPNPASDLLNIESRDEITIHIFDLDGREVFAPQLLLPNGSHQIDLQNVAEGSYSLNVTGENAGSAGRNTPVMVIH